MWIFGYGSLVWKVDFPYEKKVIGYIKGFERKFFQASIDHRGVPEKPGRVVTLVKSSNSEEKVWGIAYKINDSEADSISALNTREKRFERAEVVFFPTQNCSNDIDSDFGPFSEPILSFTYIGDPKGPLFLGDASISDIALQISTAQGPSGPNSEYVFKLCEFMRTCVPSCEDAKVWGASYKLPDNNLEDVIEQLDLREVMGYEKVPIEFYPFLNHPLNITNVVSLMSSHEDGSNEKIAEIQKDCTSDTFNGCQDGNIISNNKQSSEPNPHMDTMTQSHKVGIPFTVTMYYGSEENEHFIGAAPLDTMAQQIFDSVGPSGSNKDYLFKLADSMRQISRDALDQHLAKLEEAVREKEILYNSKSPPISIEL